jgi:Flp pilus assembly protein TadD
VQGARPLVRILPALTAAAALALSGYLLINARDAGRLEEATSALDAHHYTRALERADAVGTRPASAGALAVRARALAALGNPAAALPAFRAAVERTPHDADLRRDWAVLLLRSGQRRAARVQMTRALALNPDLSLPDGFSPRRLRNQGAER